MTDRPKLHPNCGGYYSNYFRPFFDRQPPPSGQPGTLLVTSATTGVRGGGIVRAVVRTDTVFEKLDEIAYVDRNVPCGQPYVAKWVYGRFRPPQPIQDARDIYAWYPIKVSSEGRRSC